MLRTKQKLPPWFITVSLPWTLEWPSPFFHAVERRLTGQHVCPFTQEHCKVSPSFFSTVRTEKPLIWSLPSRSGFSPGPLHPHTRSRSSSQYANGWAEQHECTLWVWAALLWIRHGWTWRVNTRSSSVHRERPLSTHVFYLHLLGEQGMERRNSLLWGRGHSRGCRM